MAILYDVLFGLGLLSMFAASSVAATLCVNPAGKFGCKSTISAAVAAASVGDTIQVARGTYKEQVVITKSLSLVALDGQEPTIDDNRNAERHLHQRYVGGSECRRC